MWYLIVSIPDLWDEYGKPIVRIIGSLSLTKISVLNMNDFVSSVHISFGAKMSDRISVLCPS